MKVKTALIIFAGLVLLLVLGGAVYVAKDLSECCTAGTPSRTAEPTVLEMARVPGVPDYKLRIEARSNGVLVAWSGSHDKHTQGFKVYRRNAGDHGWNNVIASVPSTAVYSVLDADVLCGQKYEYGVTEQSDKFYAQEPALWVALTSLACE